MTSIFRKKISRVSTVTAVLLGIATLGGCETSGQSVVSGAATMSVAPFNKYPIQVASAKDGLTIVVKPHVFALSQDDKGRVARLAQSYKHVGHGDIWVVAPTGSANSAASIGAAAEIAKVMVDQGIRPTSIRMNSYQAASTDDQAPVTIQYKRYHAYTADCGNWSGNLALSYMNQTSKNFGCTSHSNLAALVEDPHDLIEPVSVDPADPARRATVFGRYREGASTSSERSDGESGAVSDIGN